MDEGFRPEVARGSQQVKKQKYRQISLAIADGTNAAINITRDLDN